MPRKWRQRALWVLRLNSALVGIDALLLVFFAFFTGSDVFGVFGNGFFSMMLLLESGIFFLVGGIVAMSSSLFMNKVREHLLRSNNSQTETKDDKTNEKANLFILLAIVLFLESGLTSFAV